MTRPARLPSTERSVTRVGGRSRNLERRFVEAGGATTRVFGVGWSGPYPLNILEGATWKVPKVDGADMTFDLDRMLFRLETPGRADTTVHIEKSSGGGAFSGSTVGAVTLNSGDYEDVDTSGLGSVTSGDLLRIVWDTVAPNAHGYLVTLEGTEQ